jgi:hypothetical protein
VGMSLTTCFILLLIPLLGPILQLFIVLIFGAPKYIVNPKSPSNVDSDATLEGMMWFDLGTD